MRKSQLRQHASRVLSQDNRGSCRDKSYHHFVIHKMIDDLFAIKDMPPKWHALNQNQVKKLVIYWQKKNIRSATIMKYMTVIRQFLQTIDSNLTNISNQDLGLSRKIQKKKRVDISPDLLQKLPNPIARLLLNLQIHFGLTLSETMRLLPDIHIQEHALWITREIASNSQDRIIPFRTVQQEEILNELMTITGQANSLITAHGYDAIRYIYRNSLATIKLSSKHSYRYLYAQKIQTQLSPHLSNYELTLLIMREMGLQSRVTLWGYLHE